MTSLKRLRLPSLLEKTLKRDKFTYFPDGDGWEPCPSGRTVSVYAIFYDVDYNPLQKTRTLTVAEFDSDVQSALHLGSTRELRRREDKTLMGTSDIDFTSEGHKILDDMAEIYGHEPAIAFIRS